MSPGAWSRLVRVCGWCGCPSRDVRDPDCDSCGGPLAPVPQRILRELELPVPDWPLPPSAPRSLPRGYEFRVRYGRNTAVIIGIAFVSIFVFPLFDGIVSLSPDWLALLGGSFFGVIGAALWRFGARRAERWIHALKYGHAVEGTITRVFEDQGQSINDKHPWQIDFSFEAPSGPRNGFVTSWDPMTRSREAGERVWVVFNEDDPDTNALWPPVR